MRQSGHRGLCLAFCWKEPRPRLGVGSEENVAQEQENDLVAVTTTILTGCCAPDGTPSLCPPHLGFL